jgi:hypothetical protein
VYGTFAVTLAANSVASEPEELNVMVSEQSTHTSALILHESDSIFHTISKRSPSFQCITQFKVVRF